jgi:homoserine trans-succinylase
MPATPVIDIGLVNNMPDAALDATERQFRALLSAAAGDLDVRMTVYSLPEVPRTDFGRRQVRPYSNIEDLWGRRPRRLIVTGTEPQADDLTDEPCWESLTRLLEWAGGPHIPPSSRVSRRMPAFCTWTASRAVRSATSNSACSSAFRACDIRAHRGGSRHATDAALALERSSRGSAARLRLSRPDAVR